MPNMIVFFNSNFFVALSTILIGSAVIFIYKDQKKREKKYAATVMLMEIRNAEYAVEQFKRTNLSTGISILPNNSWQKFNHLFVKDLDRDELDSINNFYNQCSLAEIELRKFNSFLPLAMEEKAKAIYNKLLELADKYSNKGVENNLKEGSEYSKEKRSLLDTYYKDQEWFLPAGPQQQLNVYINNIKFITTSTLGKKLKSIAGIN